MKRRNSGAKTLIKLENLGPNFHLATLENKKIWFSYETIVGFENPNGKLSVRQNVWGPTTGKHLNRIDGGDKNARLDENRFNAEISYWL